MHPQVGGGTAFVGGLAGMIGLLIGDTTVDESLWSAWWFVGLFAISALCMVIGLYVSASAYLPLPMPRTLSERRPTASTAAQPNDRNDLADALANEIVRGNAIFDEFREAGFSPFTTADHEAVLHLSDDAMNWARGVEETLREKAPEWHPEFSSAGGYIIPDEPDPEDITVEDMQAMLGARIQLLAQIVQKRRHEGQHR